MTEDARTTVAGDDENTVERDEDSTVERDDEQTTVARNDERGRYEIRVDGTVAGYTLFRADEKGRLVFPHTVIDPAFGGRGLGSVLVREALEDVARRGETVVPECPFVVRYLRTHELEGPDVYWRPTADAAGSASVDG